jgi:hypothetical protein
VDNERQERRDTIKKAWHIGCFIRSSAENNNFAKEIMIFTV